MGEPLIFSSFAICKFRLFVTRKPRKTTNNKGESTVSYFFGFGFRWFQIHQERNPHEYKRKSIYFLA